LRLAIIITSCLGVFFAHPALAQTHAGCSGPQAEIIDDALRASKDLTLKAAVAIGDTPSYARWFGTYAPQNAEKVRSNLKSVVTAIRSGAVTAQCEPMGIDGCSAGEYAFVYAGEPYLMHLCPPFFNLPHLAALEPGTRRSENGTREGTIVHEISHFRIVASTEDHCYSRRDCSDMARGNPRRAIENADSYQYFTEDVTYFARQPIANKPPPAARPKR
jgi:peptidyl-Lys metalloendopeptidase